MKSPSAHVHVLLYNSLSHSFMLHTQYPEAINVICLYDNTCYTFAPVHTCMYVYVLSIYYACVVMANIYNDILQEVNGLTKKFILFKKKVDPFQEPDSSVNNVNNEPEILHRNWSSSQTV